jgi:4a-hydroxytetrahydrobiopterin dehydratase
MARSVTDVADLLDDASLQEWLSTHKEWERDGNSIVRNVTADSFLAGIDLVRRVAAEAERRDHHPDIDVRWRTVTFRCSTHSAGGLTNADLDLADAIDALV